MSIAEENNKCFVISPIGASGTDGHRRARNVLDYVIAPAAEKVGLQAERADDLAQPGSIATQVIQQLISAKMVVADLTELNPNVFYELAVRDSFGLPVVLIAEEGTALPFDVIQQRTVFFDSGDLGSAIPARDRIVEALREALEDPSGGSPVKAAVDLNALRSGNPEERQVAELAEQVARLSQEVASLAGPVENLRYLPRTTAARRGTTAVGTLAQVISSLSDDDLGRIVHVPEALSAERGDRNTVRGLADAELAKRAAARDQ